MTLNWLVLCFVSLFFASQFARIDSQELQQLHTHTLLQPYLDEELRIRYWDFGGNAIVNAMKHIRLTSDKPSKAGWVWSKLPLPDKAWQISLTFQIHGDGTSFFGDGLALWVTADRALGGPVFGNRDYFEGAGVFFDTYMNGNTEHYFPYVMLMLGDGKTSYDHDNDGKLTEKGGCQAEIRGKDTVTKAKLTYYRDNMLELQLQFKEEKTWITCFTVRNVKLPKNSYLGVSAMTGGVSDNHDLKEIIAYEITSAPPPKVSDTPTSSSFGMGTLHAEGGSGFFSTLVKLILFAGICGVAFTLYRTFQQQNNKRF